MTLNLAEPRVIEWLAQFELKDQTAARCLLESILAVDADELARGLRAEIQAIANTRPGPVALYAERHIRRYQGKPNRLFKESRTKPMRAYGNGPPPVPQGKPYSRETGSEGLIATLITGLVRAEPTRFLDHPGPDVLRKKRVRSYVVVTDFIGSGRRARANLEGAWQLGSFKSWRSLGYLRFAVAAFSGTRAGVGEVESHRARPEVRLHRGCPVIADIAAENRERVVELCERYAPRSMPEDHTALGYGNGGTLMVFDHGIPNNAPLLLHTAKPGWVPLFPRRSSASFSKLRGPALRRTEIDRSLTNLREARLSWAPRFDGLAEEDQELMLVLTALKRRQRWPLAVSARTGLPMLQVEILIDRAHRDGYIDTKGRPTDAAYRAMNYLKTADIPRAPLPKAPDSLYCPKSLRPPQ